LISFFEMLEDTSLRAADATITICPALADYARSRVRDDRRQLLIENSLFDPIRLAGGSAGGSSEAAGLPSDRPLVVYAGTFESYQGIEIVISAFARVVEQCPNAFLLMIGGTTRQVEAQRAFAHECGLDDHCLFTGTVDKSVAESYQRHADVLLSPRTEGMNTPLKIYEQLASGIPLVATRIPSHTQVLNDDVCILVGPDPESMANGILTALTDSERRASVVAGARALYEAKYSRSIYETKMRQLLELLA
jgi:glycosyltransferase involved in cell wall biosynthesis